MKKWVMGAIVSAICFTPVTGEARGIKISGEEKNRLAVQVYLTANEAGKVFADEKKSLRVIPSGNEKEGAARVERKAKAAARSVHTAAHPSSVSVLVNKTNALPKNYRPKDLVRPHVRFVFGNQKIEKALLRKEAAEALGKMFKKASSQRITLYAVSGFRSYHTQEILFNQEVKRTGRKEAEKAVARPGMSEHQTGLTMDVTGSSVHYALTESFSKSREGKWLAQHAHEYGFILRYPKGKENITKYKFEPWHFRYVGKKMAAAIYKKHITLEEYLGETKGI